LSRCPLQWLLHDRRLAFFCGFLAIKKVAYQHISVSLLLLDIPKRPSGGAQHCCYAGLHSAIILAAAQDAL